MSGAFDQMIGRISEFFSGLYQWKLSLTPSREGSPISGQDVKVVGYRVVTGRRMLA